MISRQIKKESSILEYTFLSSQEKTKQSIKNYSYPTRDTSQTLIPINQSLKNLSIYSSGQNNIIVSKDKRKRNFEAKKNRRIKKYYIRK